MGRFGSVAEKIRFKVNREREEYLPAREERAVGTRGKGGGKG